MPDPTTPATPDPTNDAPPQPETPETPATQSSINQRLAAEITRAEAIARTALKGAYATALGQHGLTADFAPGIVTRAGDARAAQTQAQAADVAQAGDTDSHTTLRERLTGFMQQAQAWARSIHFFSNPARLALYHVGEDLNANLPSLQQFSLDVRTAATTDALPGFTPAFLAAYNTTRTALFGPETPAAEPDPDDAAVDLRAALETQVRNLTHASMRILFLADGIWPPGRDGSAGPRHAFGLPPDRPYAPPSPEAPAPGEGSAAG